MYKNRFYRSFKVTGTHPFTVTLGQSNLYIRADSDLSVQALDALAQARGQLESYLADHRAFAPSLVPLARDPLAPAMVRAMIEAGIKSGVGPMAAVAGAIAQTVGLALADCSDRMIVENGGDLFLSLCEDQVIGIYAGDSPLSGKIGLRILASETPCGLCTSSGVIGHSYSTGDADAVTIYAKDSALADAAATATGNQVRCADDVARAVDFAMEIPDVLGVCVIRKDKLGICGELELHPLE